MTERIYTEHVATRLTTKQLRALDKAAKRAGVERGTYVRLVLNAASGTSPVADDLARAVKAGTS